MANKFELGGVAAAALAAFLTQAANAETTKDTKAKAVPAATGKCVHSCAGLSECKGNGNDAGKGKNQCANTGLVPKTCSAKTSEDDCKKVVDDKKQPICSWHAS